MSASLVGSEMCIRDSFGALVRASGDASMARADARANEHLARNLQEGAEAVSYTHLTLPTICSV
eukprot:8762665-Alexandrium_andersonii.AAC.1